MWWALQRPRPVVPRTPSSPSSVMTNKNPLLSSLCLHLTHTPEAAQPRGGPPHPPDPEQQRRIVLALHTSTAAPPSLTRNGAAHAKIVIDELAVAVHRHVAGVGVGCAAHSMYAEGGECIITQPILIPHLAAICSLARMPLGWHHRSSTRTGPSNSCPRHPCKPNIRVPGKPCRHIRQPCGPCYGPAPTVEEAVPQAAEGRAGKGAGYKGVSQLQHCVHVACCASMRLAAADRCPPNWLQRRALTSIASLMTTLIFNAPFPR